MWYRSGRIWAWASYDVANSAYTTIVVTALFNAYFVAVVAEGAEWATLLWTVLLGAANGLALAVGPWLGRTADRYAAQWWLLVAVTAGCAGATVALAGSGRGDVLYASVWLLVASFFFALSEMAIAAFLPRVAAATTMGRVSALGWGVGYLGGATALLLALAWLAGGTRDAAERVPEVLVGTGVFMGVMAIPALVALRRLRSSPLPREAMALPIWGGLFRERSIYPPHFFRALAGLFCAQAGAAVAIALAGVYIQEVLGWDAPKTVALLIAVNGTAALGTLLFGPLQDRFGAREGLMAVVLMWAAATGGAAFAEEEKAFVAAALLIGLVLGPLQSGGRTLVALLTPAGHEGLFMGWWGTAMRLAAIVGPIGYGMVMWVSGEHRLGMATTVLYFLAAALLLAGVTLPRAQEGEPARQRGGELTRGEELTTEEEGRNNRPSFTGDDIVGATGRRQRHDLKTDATGDETS